MTVTEFETPHRCLFLRFEKDDPEVVPGFDTPATRQPDLEASVKDSRKFGSRRRKQKASMYLQPPTQAKFAAPAASRCGSGSRSSRFGRVVLCAAQAMELLTGAGQRREKECAFRKRAEGS